MTDALYYLRKTYMTAAFSPIFINPFQPLLNAHSSIWQNRQKLYPSPTSEINNQIAIPVAPNCKNVASITNYIPKVPVLYRFEFEFPYRIRDLC
jgi:hypothetical protein